MGATEIQKHRNICLLSYLAGTTDTTECNRQCVISTWGSQRGSKTCCLGRSTCLWVVVDTGSTVDSLHDREGRWRSVQLGPRYNDHTRHTTSSSRPHKSIPSSQLRQFSWRMLHLLSAVKYWCTHHNAARPTPECRPEIYVVLFIRYFFPVV